MEMTEHFLDLQAESDEYYVYIRCGAHISRTLTAKIRIRCSFVVPVLEHHLFEVRLRCTSCAYMPPWFN